MNESRPSPAVGLFGRKAHVVMPLLVQKFLGTVGEGAPRHRGNCIDDPAEFVFRRRGVRERFPWNGPVRFRGRRRSFSGVGPVCFVRTRPRFTKDISSRGTRFGSFGQLAPFWFSRTDKL